MKNPQTPAEKPGPPPIYHFHPPEWLPSSSNSANIGFPNFHPPNPRGPEEALTEVSVRNGYSVPNAVLAEAFSAQPVVRDRLQSTDCVEKLGEVFNEVYRRKHEDRVSISEYTFHMPMRVTLSDAKRQSWFADLANPAIPLYKLGKNVPHGAKGHDLLDLLHSNDVAIPRAIWFLRVSGANETSGLRNKPSYNPLQYSVEWANIVVGYLKKQLAEIVLPSALRSGLNIKSSFKGVLSDPQARARWVSRFAYSLKLLRAFYDEGLVDNRTFLVWLVHQMGSCNLAQTGFVVRLVDEYLEGISTSRALAHPLVDACLVKLAEITSNPEGLLQETRLLLNVILRKLVLTQAEAYISPLLWTKYSALLNVTFDTILPKQPSLDHAPAQFEMAIRDTLRTLRTKNDALLFRPIKAPPSSQVGNLIDDVKLLNSISHQTDMSTVPYFTTSLDCLSSKLDLLLTWSVTPWQFGDHRPFVALTLLKYLRENVAERASRRGVEPPNQTLQDALFAWLDTSETAGDQANVRSVTLLFGKLVKHEIFSYPLYIQRLVARGEPGLSSSEGSTESRHRQYLRWIPLYSATPALQHQRKMTLYGIRARKVPEEEMERAIRKEIRAVLPQVFEGSTPNNLLTPADLVGRCKLLFNATRYEQVRVFRHWLIPLLKGVIEKDAHDPTSNVLKIYCTAVELMTIAKCFRAIRDLTIHVLESDPAERLLNATLDTVQRFLTIWNCSDVVSSIVHALYGAHQATKRRTKSRPLMIIIVTLDAGRHLPRESREQLFRDIGEFTQALQGNQKGSDVPLKDVPEISTLFTEEDPEAASRLANHLWLKYRSHPDWALKVWDSTMACLRQFPLVISEPAAQTRISLLYASFLQQVDKHLPTGLNPVILRWFVHAAETDLPSLTSDAWRLLIPLLLQLILDGTVQTTTLMQGVVFPAWYAASTVDSSNAVDAVLPLLSAANRLADCLILCNAEGFVSSGLPLPGLCEMQRMATQKKIVYREPHFPHLASGVLTLVAIEENSFVDNSLKQEVRRLHSQLCNERSFSRGASLHLDKMRTLCEEEVRRAETLGFHPLAKKVLNVFGSILHVPPLDSESQGQLNIDRFTCPWQMTATFIQFQLAIVECASTLRTRAAEQSSLDRLLQQLCVASPDVLHFFGRVIHDADKPIVAEKFVDCGLVRLSSLLEEPDLINPDWIHNAIDFLQVLVYIADSAPYDARVCPPFDAGMLEKMALRVQRTLQSFLEGEGSESDIHITFLGFLMRTLQLVLSFRVSWKGEVMSELAQSLVRLAVHLSTQSNPEMALCSMLIDTAYYALDVIPSVPGTTDPFKWYPKLDDFSVTWSDVPREVLSRLRSLIPCSLETKIVRDLVIATDTFEIRGPVTSHPWEWTESLGEPPPERTARQRAESTRIVVPDTSSVSLRAFNVRPTGDVIVEERGTASSDLPSMMGTFVDSLTSDSVFKRHWEESRFADLSIAKAPRQSSHTPNWHESPTASTDTRSVPSPLRTSPHSSAPGLSSSRASESHKGDEMYVDIPSVGASQKPAPKRKATSLSDDEVEIVSGPTSSGTDHSSQPKKPASKGRGKKR